ncbi:MAG: hypothetical protein Q7K45_01105 [Nanoarchaeota archaeon]|nr:hypothetical protein [Nanoarchaeota archaeon]
MNKEAHPFYSPSDQQKYINPLLNRIIGKYRKNKTTIIGIQGGQGTGKTTLTKFLQEQLQEKRYSTESFSIDDFYTSYQERQQLTRKYPHNPFYQISRGMPGTHRVKELVKTLKNIKAGKHFIVPFFDKSLQNAQGDIASERIITKKIDFLLFEGWCVGLPVVTKKELQHICKKNNIFLSKGYEVVLRFLKSYPPIWKYINYMIMLKPLSSDLHQKWRLQQEKELQQKTGRGMSKEEIGRFVDIYLPLTYAGYEKIKADAVLKINEKHRFARLKTKL